MESISFFSKSGVLVNNITVEKRSSSQIGLLQRLKAKRWADSLSPAEIAVNRLQSDLSITRQQIYGKNTITSAATF